MIYMNIYGTLLPFEEMDCKIISIKLSILYKKKKYFTMIVLQIVNIIKATCYAH